MHRETANKKRAVRKARISSNQMTETQLTRSAPFVKDTSSPVLALLAMCELTFPIPRGHWWSWLSYLLTLLKIKMLHDTIEEPFWSKWFHKESLTSEEPLFHKGFFVVKEGSSDYKKAIKRWFFKEPLTEWFFVEPKIVVLWHRCEEPFKQLYF